MAENELFDRLPGLFLKSLRKQMLLGLAPSETAEKLLGPLLDDFDHFMRELPPNARLDVLDILRIYPEVAEQHGLKPPFPVASFMERLWNRFREVWCFGFKLEPVLGFSESQDESDNELHARRRTTLQTIMTVLPAQGGDYYATERGNLVFLEFKYESENERLSFRASGTTAPVYLRLSGRPALTLSPDNQYHSLSLDQLLALLPDRETPTVQIELREEDVH